MNKPDSRLRGLYAITPDGPDQALLLEQTTQALRGGARIVQYRNKSRSRGMGPWTDSSNFRRAVAAFGACNAQSAGTRLAMEAVPGSDHANAA